MSSPHEHHHHGHGHHLSSSGRTLGFALALTLGFSVVEFIGGWLSSSLALMGDAGHMLTDASALGIALFAAWLAAKPASATHSYGLGRAEALAAMVNSILMIFIVVGIVVSAVQRLQTPREVDGLAVIVIAAIGLLVNLAVMYVLTQGEQTLNARGALLHVMGDLLGSVAAIIAGAVVYFTGWYPIDAILSLLICIVILYSSLRLLKEVISVIMEGVPSSVDLPQVGRAMAAIEGVHSVHDLHIWTLSSGRAALSAHMVVENLDNWQLIMDKVSRMLAAEYAIEHITLQPEPLVRVVDAAQIGIR